MRIRTILFITALLLCHPILWPQALTKQLPPALASTRQGAVSEDNEKLRNDESTLPDAPGYPLAQPVPEAPSGTPVRLQYDQLEKRGNVFTLSGHVRIDYESYTLMADRIVFDRSTGIATAEGHLQLEGGPDDELVTASHGVVDFQKDTGHFYEVTGTIGTRVSMNQRRLIYTTANPFIFTGKEVIKEGPHHYRVIGGSMTSCRLPRPDWRILAREIEVKNGKGTAKNSYFKLLDVPILYLPYATHPVGSNSRQTGLLIPVIGTSSTKGTVVGESIYWAINRSTDAVLGTQYFSERGWSPSGQFRYRGRGEDFINFRFTALLDRGLGPEHLDQGGEDILFSARRDFPGHEIRAAVTGEYLSSYVYREAFAESFALAVASEVKSSAFATRSHRGYSTSISFARYQNFEGISREGNGYYTPQIRILHLPNLDFDALDRPLGSTRAVWGMDSSLTGLTRSEPGFATGAVGRVDVHPHLGFPIHAAGWTFRPEVGARDTYYSRSQVPSSTEPDESHSGVNRTMLEAGFLVRPPVLVRDYSIPWLEHLLGGRMRHTIEPEFSYRFTGGVDNFRSILRFDADDVASNTNEADYLLTQRLFFRRLHPQACTNAPLPPATSGVIPLPATYRECGGDTDAWLTWKVEAKTFFDPNFGGAVVPQRRNVLDTTLGLTGVAFLGGPRNTSPVVSRLKLNTSHRSSFEWDADYDARAGRLNVSNVFANYHEGEIFGSLGYATLEALNPSFSSNGAGEVTKYDLLRLLGGFGSPSKRGLSLGANAGWDFTQNALQYGGIQTAYNWDCCGFNVEYRRLALGSVRNENQYSFSFTLAGIGSAGNLKHSEQIF